MTSLPTETSPPFRELADQLTKIADCVRDYVNDPPLAWPSSIWSRDQAQERDFAALPFAHVMGHVRATPLNYLGSSADHLTAMAAILRTPMTVLALSTVLRTQLVAAACAHYLLDSSSSVDVHERVRRTMNCYLVSLAERIVMMDGLSNPAIKAERGRRTTERRNIGQAGQSLGWELTKPNRPRPGRPEVWRLGSAFPSDQQLLRQVMDSVDAEGARGVLVHRLLSATTHAQQHGLLGFIEQGEDWPGNGDGTSTIRLRLPLDRAVMYVGLATSTLTLAVMRGCVYYGWRPQPWQAVIQPITRMIGSSRSAAT